MVFKPWKSTVERLDEPNQAQENTRPLARRCNQYVAGIQDQEKLSGERIWSCAVYELYNISYTEDTEALNVAALSGNLSREAYVTAVTQIEFKAVRRTAEFYHSVWSPYSKNRGLATHDEYWFASAPETYDGWIARYSGSSYYPYKGYGEFYDNNIVPYLRAQANSKVRVMNPQTKFEDLAFSHHLNNITGTSKAFCK